MANITYRCPDCRAELKWQAAKNGFVCEYCDGEFTLEELDSKNTQIDPNNVSEGQQISEEERQFAEVTDSSTYGVENAQLVSYKCPHCMAEIITSNTTAATTCVYCNRPIVLAAQVIGDFTPKAVIPFKTDQQKAQSQFEKFMKKPLTPNAFKRFVNINKVQGVYVPFWSFTGFAKGGINAVGEKSYNSGDYKITEEYSVLRRADVSFKNIPVDASAKIENAAMDSIEPFDMSELKDFNSAYLSGFLAERYDESAEQVRPRLEKRVKGSMHNFCVATVEADLTLKNCNDTCHIQEMNSEYIMLPAWILHCEYKNKKYLFAMNGQTGKFIGNLPIDIGKLLSYTGIVAALVSLIAGFIPL